MSGKQVKIYKKKNNNNKITLSCATDNNLIKIKHTKIGMLLNAEARLIRYNKINANTRFLITEILTEQKKIKQCPVCAAFFHEDSEHDPWNFKC